VAETLNTSGNGQAFTNPSITVDFPAPDGPEMMMSLPRLAFMWRWVGKDSEGEKRSMQVGFARFEASIQRLTGLSFNVLDQLAHLLDLGFDGHHMMGDDRIIRF
jgi:hypothetical protein